MYHTSAIPVETSPKCSMGLSYALVVTQIVTVMVGIQTDPANGHLGGRARAI